jgi:hypothetical protein
MADKKGYYKGEGGGFPQEWVVVSFVSTGFWLIRAQTMH